MLRATTPKILNVPLNVVLSLVLVPWGVATAVGATDCGWYAAAVRLAQLVAASDSPQAQGLRDQLQRLDITPDSVGPPECAPTTGDGSTPGGGSPGSTTGDPSDPDQQDGPAAQLPSDVLDLTNWYLTLPTGSKGKPRTVTQPDLNGYRSSWFELNDDRDGVAFTANAGGVTTANSSYPRSELREMDGSKMAAWTSSKGVHTMSLRQAVTALPEEKPEVVTAQIHDGSDDVMQVRLEGTKLIAQYDDGRKDITIDPRYVLGTPYDLEIVATKSGIVVNYNGTKKAQIKKTGSKWYFKAGAYLQSNTSKGEDADAVGTVVIYQLAVTHR